MAMAPHTVLKSARLMPAGLHDVSDDGFLAQLFARLQTMQPFHHLVSRQDRSGTSMIVCTDAMFNLALLLSDECRTLIVASQDIKFREVITPAMPRFCPLAYAAPNSELRMR
jgi:hypothetical protein